MIPTSLPDPEEPFIYTTTQNTIIVIEDGTVQILDSGSGQICVSLGDLEEILSALAANFLK
jgi:hypothetical protein